VIVLAAPVALASGNSRLSLAAAFIYEGAGLICHQRPERSFHTAGVQQPVCARCAGLYISGAVGAMIAWVPRRRPRFARDPRMLLVMAALPTALTFGVELVGAAHPSNVIRALSALPLGAALSWAFVLSLRVGDAQAVMQPAAAHNHAPQSGRSHTL
jgi:uncharacterized membrane protein